MRLLTIQMESNLGTFWGQAECINSARKKSRERRRAEIPVEGRE
jgi:hypothetical protein